ncbi:MULTISPECIES: shikimate kinase [Corynebacterium]|jgi:shikimate kinase|uniref:Shikimate kinase n=1 Tax=Corynebacterium accolens TaxID=38284 RepID=A0AAP4BWB4_9CORY|nr:MULTISPECIES: shikimate kinase [Corynebacterium]MCT1408742.1 shikimate kinase [Corynebacterium accolens]MDK4244914.1 shikimate kinase [Corynebacterium accolens]MDK4260040.1 shikimate kinase [Corynebacterium accolens]MDK4262567.1 shikimate kinase [Corynebacterium accolens]MDK4268417.1 shikimate kinase [Corynebacterium accolens]
MMTTPTDVTGQPHPCVVLIGPPGAGKSTIGRRLSHALNCDLVDSDHLIEMAEGKPCGEVFSEKGEPAFRELEAEHVAEALQKGGVVSLGGGAVMTASTRELLERHTVVFLDISAEEGARRTADDRNRPVLAADNPVEHYRSIVETRRPFYLEVADFRVRTDTRSPQQVVGDILGFLETL